MTKDIEREAFEAYMAEKYKNLMDRRQCLNNGGGYMAWDMNVAWKVWQAAKAQAVPEWIETAIQPPEEGQTVIISGIYGVGIAEFSYMYKNEFVMYDMGASNPILSKDQVKFWMPLPDAPQEPAND